MKSFSSVAIALFSFMGLASQAPPKLSQCTGHRCVSDLVFMPPPGWTVTVSSTRGGKGEGVIQEGHLVKTCSPCEWCRAQVNVSFSGACSWIVGWPDHPRTGAFSFPPELYHLDQDCDGTLPGIIMSDNCSEVTGHVDLWCPCCYPGAPNPICTGG
jgi:hypothetical protein